jgi:hypothetical protein
MRYEFKVLKTVNDPAATELYLNEMGNKGWHPVLWTKPEGSYNSQIVLQREVEPEQVGYY